jgi:hypothetical protein
MADKIYFSRDTKCYIEFNDAVWEVPVLDGFSFSQGNESTEITLAEMEDSTGTSRRGRRAFNTALAPGEWSISTYVRPFKSAGSGAGKADDAEQTHAVEEVLWGLFLGAREWDSTAFLMTSDNITVDGTTDNSTNGEKYVIDTAGTTNWTSLGAGAATVGTIFTRNGTAATGSGGIARRLVNDPGTSSSAFNAQSSNRSSLGTCNLYFVLGDADRSVYKLKDGVVNEATLDFDIDGIATINWSGQCSEVIEFTGSTIESDDEPNNGDTTQDATALAVGDVWLDSNDSYKLYVCTDNTDTSETFTTRIAEDVTETDNFIRNRLSQLTATSTDSTNFQSSYDLTLTGGSLSFSNNVSYITPEELGVVNTPFAHVTGTRTIGGSFTCYLTLNSTTLNSNKSRDLFDDLRNASTVVTNSFNLTFKIGGTSGNRLEVNLPTCHIEIPTHSIEDVISMETNFMALPSTVSETDEMTLTYKV